MTETGRGRGRTDYGDDVTRRRRRARVVVPFARRREWKEETEGQYVQ